MQGQRCRARLLVVACITLVCASYKALVDMDVTVAERRNALRIFTGLDPLDATEVLPLRPKTTTIAMLGDSTTRNQLSLLCDLILTEASEVDRLRTLKCIISGGFESGDNSSACTCRGKSWITGGNIVAAGHFYKSPMFAAAVPEALMDLRQRLGLGREEPFDVVYFGSTAMHFLTLVPARPLTLAPDHSLAPLHFEENLQRLVKEARASSRCTIFQSVNHVCHQAFRANYQKIVEAANFNKSYWKSCQAATRHFVDPELAAEACWQFQFTSQGSHVAAAIERKVVMPYVQDTSTPMHIVDRFTHTKDRCWATRPGDGRHYYPLLPFALKEFLLKASKCLSLM
mmetsp:Transcript_11849/g.34224  ORF Transcript_11849/g.34224 Transcript_11849/m.34224 type:complete len:343 (+) Transcript_11849:168-1196(+)